METFVARNLIVWGWNLLIKINDKRKKTKVLVKFRMFREFRMFRSLYMRILTLYHPVRLNFVLCS